MIGLGDTKAARPNVPQWVDGYNKGVQAGLVIRPRVTGLTYIWDDFDTLDDWIPVYGKLNVTGGATSDVYAPFLYSAARHKTSMLTDNHKVTVTINDGVVLDGESRVLICADEMLSRYYGIAIETATLGSDHVSIIRGRNNISVDRYQRTAITVAAGDQFTVWYNRLDSTVRIYQNGSWVAEQYFPPTDIPHGPNCRYIGIVPGCKFMLAAGVARFNNGVKFDNLEAEDIVEALPVIFDPVDQSTPNAGWTVLSSTGLRIWRHLFRPPSLGPNHLLGESAAAKWTTPLNTDSARIQFELLRAGGGRFTLLMRSNSALSSAIGIQFDCTLNTVYAVKATGISSGIPTITKINATEVQHVIGQHVWQYTATYNNATNTIKLFRGASRTPLVQWAASTNFTPAGRYVGCMWNTTLLTVGIELTQFDGYDVDTNSPLPGS